MKGRVRVRIWVGVRYYRVFGLAGEGDNGRETRV